MASGWHTFVPSFPRQMWILAGAAFVNFLGYMVMPFLVLYLTGTVGLALETAGFLLTLFGAGNILGAWFGGQVSDRIGSENVLVLSFVLSALVLFAYPSFADVVLLGAVTFVLALANGAFRPAYDACVVKYCPEDERARAYAIYVVAINIGAGVAVAVAGSLFSFRPALIFYVDGLTSVIAALLVFFLLAERRHSTKHTTSLNEGIPALPPYKNVLFWIACLAAFVVDSVARQLSVTLPIFVTSAHGMSPQSFGNLLTLGYFLFAAAVLPMSAWIKRKSQRVIAASGIGVIGIGFAGLPFVAGSGPLVGLYVLITIGQLLFYPAIMALVMGEAARHGGKRGAYMGFYRTIQAIAGVGAPAVGTFVYASFGPTALWVFCAVGAGGFAVILALTRRLEHRTPLAEATRKK